ncbi:molybdopterin synthase sulfur carrier subunit [Micromonospora sp. M12]
MLCVRAGRSDRGHRPAARPTAREADGASRLSITAVGTLRAVLDELAAHHPRLARRIRDERGELRRYVNVFVDGRTAGTPAVWRPGRRRRRGAGVAVGGGRLSR